MGFCGKDRPRNAINDFAAVSAQEEQEVAVLGET